MCTATRVSLPISAFSLFCAPAPAPSPSRLPRSPSPPGLQPSRRLTLLFAIPISFKRYLASYCFSAFAVDGLRLGTFGSHTELIAVQCFLSLPFGTIASAYLASSTLLTTARKKHLMKCPYFTLIPPQSLTSRSKGPSSACTPK